MRGIVAFAFFFLLGTFFLTCLSSGFRRLRKYRSQNLIKSLGYLFFYQHFQNIFFKHKSFEILFFATVCARHIVRFCYAASSVFLLIYWNLSADNSHNWEYYLSDLFSLSGMLSFLLMIFISLCVGDFLPRTWALYLPKSAITYSAIGSSFFLTLCFPISFIFLRLSNLFSRAIYVDRMREPITHVKEKIIELIQETDHSNNLDANDRKIIKSMVTFRDRVVREVMVPRIHVFSLPLSTSIREAAQKIREEGYSRIPVFKESIDHVVGVLMYKDVLDIYQDATEQNQLTLLDEPIEHLVKTVLYTPETKKISDLLQEFKSKQMHLAIVVDEYGGTEGIVSIEDILEEIVGEIEDEYDEDEDILYQKKNTGGWIVDARMSIHDIEEKLSIKIPQEGDYDTIGGYVFHRMGTIPEKGLVIHHDEFELEILSSSDRCVEKMSINPVFSSQNSQEE